MFPPGGESILTPGVHFQRGKDRLVLNVSFVMELDTSARARRRFAQRFSVHFCEILRLEGDVVREGLG